MNTLNHIYIFVAYAKLLAIYSIGSLIYEAVRRARKLLHIP